MVSLMEIGIYLPFLAFSGILITTGYFISYSFIKIGAYGISFLILLPVVFDLCVIYLNSLLPEEKIPKNKMKGLSDTRVMLTRRSCRNFQNKKLSQEVIDKVEKIIKETKEEVNFIGNNKDKVRIVLVKKRLKALMISGATNFLVGIIPKKYEKMDVNDCGSYLQRVVIKLLKMGLSKCYVGGFVGNNVIKNLEKFDKDSEHVAVIIPIGYQSKYKTIVAIATEKFVGSKRFENKDLFYDETYGNKLMMSSIGNYSQVLRCFKWSPSACNYQPWKILKKKQENGLLVFHVYSEHKSQYYKYLDNGISRTNFEIAIKECNFNGHFFHEDPKLNVPKNAVYIMSFKEDEN